MSVVNDKKVSMNTYNRKEKTLICGGNLEFLCRLFEDAPVKLLAPPMSSCNTVILLAGVSLLDKSKAKKAPAEPRRKTF